MSKVRLVTAFVPLEGQIGNSLQPTDFHILARRMIHVVPPAQRTVYGSWPIEEIWLYNWLAARDWLDLPPSLPTEPDRFATPRHFVSSCIVMHARTQFLKMAALAHPDAEILVWLDYGILKQGVHTGKQVQPHHITRFLAKVERYYAAGHRDIPFPGIEPQTCIHPTWNSWRFCGSTHVIPRWHLDRIDEVYRKCCGEAIDTNRSIPIDLPIWATVEWCYDQELPYRWYRAEHDYTQLENFPEPG